MITLTIVGLFKYFIIMKNILLHKKHFEVIERIIFLVTFFITIMSAVILPVYHKFFDQPNYNFTMNYPAGWQQGDRVFNIYNHSDAEIGPLKFQNRAFMVLSREPETIDMMHLFNKNNIIIPIPGFDLNFKRTGNLTGLIGYVEMTDEINPLKDFASFSINELGEFYLWEVNEYIQRLDQGKNIKTAPISISHFEFVVFTIITDAETLEEMKSFSVKPNLNLYNVKIFATNANNSKQVKVTDFLSYYYDIEYERYLDEKSYNKFWKNQKFYDEVYQKFIELEVEQLKKQ
uniref:Uncharacterized protein n=2 Tax=Streptococcus suis TaxID=1307 RepID=A0A1C9IGP0_STRSU|nr:hypothetical protein YS205-orf27 [Streptococcus suis]AOP03678.1 hypothetical protein YS191-orf27 [Streptococcus suis]AOP03710.1 hypothetical protein YS196-orf27 [Streptococcus suis]